MERGTAWLTPAWFNPRYGVLILFTQTSPEAFNPGFMRGPPVSALRMYAWPNLTCFSQLPYTGIVTRK